MQKLLSYHLKRIREEDVESSWKLVYDSFQPAKEALREALCTLGNGYFATRGAAPEARASRIHYPGTYIAGVYNKLTTHLLGKMVTDESLVNCPNWLCLTLRLGDGEWLQPCRCKILFYYQELDMHRGLLSRKVRLRDKAGHIFTIETQRIVHMSHPHLAAIRYVIFPENYRGWLTIRSGLDGTVENTGVARYRQLNSRHLKPYSLKQVNKNTIHLSVQTTQSRIIISQAARTHIFLDGSDITPKGNLVTQAKLAIYQEFKIFVHKNREYQVEKVVSLYTSRDKGVRSPTSAAIHSVKTAHKFAALFKTHKKSWYALWKKFDIDIQGEITFRKIIRLHIFHLLQSASLHNVNIDAGLPARGLHGEAYRGHIFWDELYIMPFYNLHAPEISRALLLYRYRRLQQARKNARRSGFKGAMFPWQSAALGDEQTPRIHLNPMSGKWDPDFSHFQRHVSFAVAYNVWEYWKYTEDMDFLLKYGAEMILSVAQFGASLARYHPGDKRYHTEGLMGPDEFHEKLPQAHHPGFKDNAYTNFLIVATLLKAQEVLEILPAHHRSRLLKKLQIDRRQLQRWDEITRRMNIIIDQNGIIAQFQGYFKLKELDWQAYRKRYGNIHRMDRILKAEGKSPNAYQLAKQADVLMIFYLFPLSEVKYIFTRLGYRFDKEMLEKNYTYYVARTSHGSTLSKVVHCYIAHLLGRQQEAWRWFLEVLKSDIYDTQGGTTPEGIHTGVMGGSINIAIKSFAGIHMLPDRISIAPTLPKNWRSIKLRLLYKGRWIFLSITRRRITLFIRGPRVKPYPVPIEIYGRRYIFLFGKIYRISLERQALYAVRGGIPKMVQERILIVDGDIMQAVMLKSRLEALGYLVDCAYSGNQALGILRTEWVDLIILAVALQGDMSGFQLFKELRADEHFCTIPVIVQSSKAGMEEMFTRLGVESFFRKPYPVDILLKEVKKIIARKV